MTKDQALTRVQVLSAAPWGPGMAASSHLPAVGATQGCDMQGSRCIQMCSVQGPAWDGTASRPVRAWGLGRSPCPQLCQGENRLPNFTWATVLRATNSRGNLLQFFLPGPTLLHLCCLLGLPGELRTGLFGEGRSPKNP